MRRDHYVALKTQIHGPAGSFLAPSSLTIRYHSRVQAHSRMAGFYRRISSHIAVWTKAWSARITRSCHPGMSYMSLTTRLVVVYHNPT
jgi:hypothetical protein